MLVKELWVDDPPSVVLAPGYLEAVQQTFSGIAVMIDDAPIRWKPTWSLKQWENLCVQATTLGLRVSITTWPWPNKAVLDTMFADLERYVGIASVNSPYYVGEESDLEHNWKAGVNGRNVKGFTATATDTALEVAAKYLLWKKRDLEEDVKGAVENQVTTFPGHSELSKGADVSLLSDVLFIQAYSCRHRKRLVNGKTETWEVPWEHQYGPGQMQNLALSKAVEAGLLACSYTKVGIGIAGWDQQWPGHTIQDALATAVKSGVGNTKIRYKGEPVPVNRLRVWSSKWLYGVRSKSKQSQATLKDLREVLKDY